MLASNFYPSEQSFVRQNLRGALLLVDLASAPAVGLAVNFFTRAEAQGVGLAGLWIVGAWAAWALSRPTRVTVVLDPYSRAAVAPLAALLITSLILALIGAALPLPYLLAVTAAWGGVLLLARLLLRRLTPPVVIGVLPHLQGAPHPDKRVRYLPLLVSREVSLRETDALLFEPSGAYSQDWLDLIMHAQVAGVPVWTRADLNEDLTGRISLEFLHEQRLNPTYFRSRYVVLKRVFDVLASVVALPALLPVLALVAALVLIDAGWPILFWQERVGQGGRIFRIAKFRTMRRDSERGGAAFAAQGDVRVTRLGKWLRKFRLDELPQFWNVLRGDMSIIGPRPEQKGFVEQFERDLHLYRMRHWVRPGITGWAQVMHGYAGEGETSLKLRFDAYYIKHFSFWLDVRIVVRTLWTILTGFGAR